jgi:hypothetical protein
MHQYIGATNHLALQLVLQTFLKIREIFSYLCVYFSLPLGATGLNFVPTVSAANHLRSTVY